MDSIKINRVLIQLEVPFREDPYIIIPPSDEEITLTRFDVGLLHNFINHAKSPRHQHSDCFDCLHRNSCEENPNKAGEDYRIQGCGCWEFDIFFDDYSGESDLNRRTYEERAKEQGGHSDAVC